MVLGYLLGGKVVMRLVLNYGDVVFYFIVVDIVLVFYDYSY